MSEADETYKVVETSDVKQLTRVPGVGKKTAERMILELEGKLKGLSPSVTVPAPKGPISGAEAAAVDALVRMGFKPAETERAVASVGEADLPLGELIRQALAILTP